MKKILIALVLTLPAFAFAQANMQGRGDLATAPVATAQVAQSQIGGVDLSGANTPQLINQVTSAASQAKQPSLTSQPGSLQPSLMEQQISQLQQQVVGLKGLVELQGNQLQQLQLQVKMMQHGSSASTSHSNANNQSSTDATSSSSNNASDQSMYQSAYNLVQNKKYTQATQAMNDYLQKYPNGTNAAKAHYWLGELYAMGGDQKNSVSQFIIVVNNYANSSKAPDAMLQLGIIAYGTNQFAQAKSWFGQITSKYPNSSASQLASQKLLQLQQAGY